MTRRDQSANELRPTVGRDFWATHFRASQLVFCLSEMIKNGRDWGATQIDFTTRGDKSKFRYVDDGEGMNAANRHAFVSLAATTAKNPAAQSAKFGTGAKYMIFTYAERVRVVTAPRETPDQVYIFEFTPDDLADAYSGQKTIPERSAAKTSRNWPYDHPFGTEITYTLKDPNARSIHRDAGLAKRLSARLDLPLLEQGVVRVNGQPLPGKDIVGEVYRLDLPASKSNGLGWVRLSFYRPAKRSSEEDLRMTGRMLGEVSFRRMLVEILTDDQREFVPPLYLEPEVCGLIAAEFLDEHATESRDRYDESVADDERIRELLRLLSRIEHDVAKALGIELKRPGEEEVKGRDQIDKLIDRLQQHYNPSGELPEGYHGSKNARSTGLADNGKGGRQGGGARPKQARLTLNQPEFELGEVIVVELTPAEGESVSDYRFDLDQARAALDNEKLGIVRLVANQAGRGTVRAINPRTKSQAKADYIVSSERQLRLSSEHLVVEVGSAAVIRALNADKARGTLDWELVSGSGEFRVTGDTTASFTPDRVGSARITMYDSANHERFYSCEIRAVPPQDKQLPFRVKDHFFTLDVVEGTRPSQLKTVTIVASSQGNVHLMVINPLAPGYVAAYRAGSLSEALLSSMAVEYVKTFQMILDEDEAIDPEDFMSRILKLQLLSDALFAEMLGN